MGKSIWRFVRYQWEGRHPLLISFLVVGVGIQVVRLLAAAGPELVGNETEYGVPYFIALLSAYLIVLVLEIWWFVGTWRSAGSFRHPVWSPLARAVTYVFIPLIAIANIYSAPPRIYDAYLNAREDPQWGPRSVVEKGNTLEVSGYLTRSVATAVNDHVKHNTNLKAIHLESKGGRIGPALKIGRIAKSARLDTIVSDQCLSACAVAFLGGHGRVILSGARLGFRAVTYADKIDHDANKMVISYAMENGVRLSFLRKVLSDRQMSYPSAAELVDANVVTEVIP